MMLDSCSREHLEWVGRKPNQKETITFDNSGTTGSIFSYGHSDSAVLTSGPTQEPALA